MFLTIYTYDNTYIYNNDYQAYHIYSSFIHKYAAWSIHNGYNFFHLFPRNFPYFILLLSASSSFWILMSRKRANNNKYKMTLDMKFVFLIWSCYYYNCWWFKATDTIKLKIKILFKHHRRLSIIFLVIFEQTTFLFHTDKFLSFIEVEYLKNWNWMHLRF